MLAVETKAFSFQPRCGMCSALVKCLFYLLVYLQLLVERITAESKNGSKAQFLCFSWKMHVVNTPVTTIPHLCYVYVHPHHWTIYMR